MPGANGRASPHLTMQFIELSIVCASPATSRTDSTRRSPRARRIAVVVATALLLLTALLPPRAVAQDEPEEGGLPRDWAEAIEGYQRDPGAYRARLLALGREAGAPLPPPIQVLLADAYLRGGQVDAAEALLQEALKSNPAPPWDVFAKLGLGGASMMRGDPAGAEVYFAEVASAPEPSSQIFGNLGLGHALLASDRPMDAKAAFDAAGANKVVDEQFRQAGQFGSATSLYAAGDYKAAAEAFDALAASDPKGQIGLDARYAAARARLAMGDRSAAISALKGMESRCAKEKTSGRAPRTLRNLDGRAFSRAWIRNYQRMGWYEALGRETTMYTIGGCDLARSTLRQIQAADAGSGPAVRPASAPAAGTVQQVAVPALQNPSAPGEAPKAADASGSGRGWLAWVAVGVAVVSITLVLRRRRSA